MQWFPVAFNLVAFSVKTLAVKNDSFSLAAAESGGFFNDVLETDWRLLKERFKSTPHCSPPLTEGCKNEASANDWFQLNAEPSFTCLHERRIGDWGDGGKWVCDPHRIAQAPKKCLVYSVGSDNDFSFEKAIHNQIPTCEIHTFDHTIGEHPSRKPDFVDFHPWAVSIFNRTILAKPKGNKTASRTITRLEKRPLDMVLELGHVGLEIDILKIDCEGCELKVVRELLAIKPRQILVEVHDWGRGKYTLVNFFEQCYNAGYVIFHKEANIVRQNRGKRVEFAFLRLSRDFMHPLLNETKERT